MSVGTHELAPFQPLLNDLVQAREHTDQYGEWRGIHESLEGRQNAINYELAKKEEAGVVTKVVDEINAADDTVLDKFQRAIAVKVIAHQWRTPMDESLGLVSAGFQVMERVKEGAEQNRGTIAILGKSSIALYESFGSGDLQTRPVDWAKGHHAIVYTLSNGKSIGIEKMKGNSFPDPKILAVQLSETGLTADAGDRVAEQLSRLDPSSNKYALPFVHLGTAEQPGDGLNDHLKTDAQRFAGRLLVKATGRDSWIQVKSPSDELSATVVDRFSDIYQDLLVGDTPRDVVPHLRSENHFMSGTTDVYNVRLRNTSLASHGRTNRGNIFYAADISEADVEAATREKVAKLEESTSPNAVIKALRAKQFMDAFFAQLAESV